MPSRMMSWVFSPVISASSKTMAPARARGLPQTVISSVDLPAPLAPISETIAPRGTSMLTPRSAWMLP